MDDDAPEGLSAAVARALEIAEAECAEMYVSYSPDGEYTSSDDIVATTKDPATP